MCARHPAGRNSPDVAHRMLEPAVLNDWTHLLVHDHILQVLQGRMLANFVLKWQHVLAQSDCKEMEKMRPATQVKQMVATMTFRRFDHISL